MAATSAVRGAIESYFGAADEAAGLLVQACEPSVSSEITNDAGKSDSQSNSSGTSVVRDALELYFGSPDDAAAAIMPVEPSRKPAQGRIPLPSHPPWPLAHETFVLEELPSEILEIVMSCCTTISLLALSASSRKMRAVAEDPHLWRRKFVRRYHRLLPIFASAPWASLPRGVPRPNVEGETYKQFYFTFERTWMALAAQHGRCIMRINGCIYDVTEFADQHPGEPYVLRSAAGSDATDAFHFVGHSSQATEILRQYLREDLELPGEERSVDGLGQRSPSWGPMNSLSAMADLADKASSAMASKASSVASTASSVASKASSKASRVISPLTSVAASMEAFFEGPVLPPSMAASMHAFLDSMDPTP